MSTSVPYSPDPVPSEPYPAAPAAPAAAAAAAAAAEPDSGERVAWWLALGGALTGVVLGIVVLVWPEATLKVVAALFGVWLLLHGVVLIVQAFTATGNEGAERAILGVIGMLFVVAGVIALRNLLVSLAVVITLIGLMWLIGGFLELISAFSRGGGGDRVWRAVLGGLSIVAALVVLVWPELSLLTLVYVTGAWMIILGLIEVALIVWASRSVTV